MEDPAQPEKPHLMERAKLEGARRYELNQPERITKTGPRREALRQKKEKSFESAFKAALATSEYSDVEFDEIVQPHRKALETIAGAAQDRDRRLMELMRDLSEAAARYDDLTADAAEDAGYDPASIVAEGLDTSLREARKKVLADAIAQISKRDSQHGMVGATEQRARSEIKEQVKNLYETVGHPLSEASRASLKLVFDTVEGIDKLEAIIETTKKTSVRHKNLSEQINKLAEHTIPNQVEEFVAVYLQEDAPSATIDEILEMLKQYRLGEFIRQDHIERVMREEGQAAARKEDRTAELPPTKPRRERAKTVTVEDAPDLPVEVPSDLWDDVDATANQTLVPLEESAAIATAAREEPAAAATTAREEAAVAPQPRGFMQRISGFGRRALLGFSLLFGGQALSPERAPDAAPKGDVEIENVEFRPGSPAGEVGVEEVRFVPKPIVNENGAMRKLAKKEARQLVSGEPEALRSAIQTLRNTPESRGVTRTLAKQRIKDTRVALDNIETIGTALGDDSFEKISRASEIKKMQRDLEAARQLWEDRRTFDRTVDNG